MAEIISKQIIASLGVRELRITEMKGEEKFDIRKWNGDKYEDGVRFNDEEIKQLYELVSENKLGGAIGNKNFVVADTEYQLSIVNNGRKYIRTIGTKEEIEKFVEIYKECDGKLREYKVEEPKAEEPKVEEKPKPEEKSNIIQFPKPKVEIEKMITEGNATYEQCEEKINKDKEIYKDSDSQYVLDGILELCKVDSDFRNNVMREDKSYAGAFEYMAKMAKEGYAYKIGQAYSMDRDMGLGFTIDYFNSKPEEPKPKATPKPAAKRGRKKKGA